MNNKISHQFWLTSLITSCLLTIFSINTPVNAQFRGQESQKFFERGNAVIEEQIQELQREQKEEEDTKEPTLITESDSNEPTIDNNDIDINNNEVESQLENKN